MAQKPRRSYSLSESVLLRLHKVVAEHRSRGDSRLPTVKELASITGASPVTVCKAMRRLVKDGVVSSAPRRGITLVSGAPARGQPSGGLDRPDASMQEGVATGIRRDIFAGRFRHRSGFLPSVKELSAAYGVSPGQTGKILNAMVDQGVLHKRHKRYRIAVQPPEASSSSILLFARGNNTRGIDLQGERHQELAAWFERTCHDQNIRFRAVGISLADPISPALAKGRDQGASPTPGESILGYVVMPAGLGRLGELVRMLASTDKPTVILDENGAVNAAAADIRHDNVWIFSVSNSPACSLHVGRRLFGLGHTKVAYISPWSDVLWSVNRYQGLVDAYREAGLDGCVAAVTGSGAADRALTRLFNQPSSYGIVNGEHLAMVIADAGYASPPPAQHIIAVRREKSGILRQVSNALTVLFDRARATGATAWVVCNDTFAVPALHYLAQKRVKVPEEISVVSYDGTNSAVKNDLASFDFNMPGIAHAIVSTIQTPRVARSVYRSSPVEIDGMLWGRGSLGPAPRQG
jgi:DNA-binding LacI/PurR family transcriptional regulator/DNA-binding transcriptional regulator YhcF (GntR family)